jgi:hypothetical protein
MKDYKKYEEDVIDVDELDGTDIKINPDYYIHKTLEKLNDALLDDSLREGFVRYRILVEQAEIMVKSSNMVVVDEYDREVEEYKATEAYRELTDEVIKGLKVAQFKLKLLLSAIFSSKVATEPARL